MYAWKPVFAGIVLIFASTAVAQQRPQPADPLSATEREKAVSIAREEALRQGLLRPDQFRVVGSELFVLKDSAARARPVPTLIQRSSSVLFYRSDRQDGLQALVDLTAGRVREFATIKGSSVPIGREEVEQAVALALGNESVRKLLGQDAGSFRLGISNSATDNSVQGLRVVGAGPNDPCTRQRCVDLFFRRHGRFISGSRVTVNLSAKAVLVTSERR